MKDKVLIVVPTCNTPHFLEHFVESFNRYDPGYDHELLILDQSSDNPRQLKTLDKISKKHRVEIRLNTGRAQGGYNYAWQNNKDYKYYFFIHDDSAFIRNDWLKLAVDRIEDQSYESVWVNRMENAYDMPIKPIGRVGFQAYEWQNRYKYLRTGYRTLFYYLDELIDNILKIDNMPQYYQHINDDRILYKNELLQKAGKIWNLEDYRNIQGTEFFNKVYKFFDDKGLVNKVPFPNNNYPVEFHPFEIVIELLSDICPMRYGYRTHCVTGDGHCQEELGWNSFWGNNYIVHYGDHVVFKGLSRILKTNESEIKKSFKNKTFLQICDNIIKKETLK